MLVTRGAACAVNLAAARRPLALAIGNFDGVHKGHQAIIERVKMEAGRRGLDSGVLTFEPHPREYFERARRGAAASPPSGASASTSAIISASTSVTPSVMPSVSPPSASAPTRLTSLREKLELLQAQGLDRVHIQRFHARFAAMAPEAFVEQVLEQSLQARWVLVGDDFRFGARRAGDTTLLRALSARHGFELEVMPAIEQGGLRVSSGAVREALARGELDRARALLGRPYSISGRVVHGDKLGRELGCSTANIQLKHNRPPLTGIFAVRLHGLGSEPKAGVASLGVRPTVKSGGAPVLEVHLFDFAGDLYGRHLKVDFLHKIRDEEKFADLEALRLQIERDCEAARSFLMEHGDG